MTSVLFNGVAPTAQITPDVEATKFASNAFSLQCFIWDDSDLPVSAGTFACTATTASANSNNCGQILQAFTGVEQVVPGASLQGRATSTSADTTSSVTVTPVANGSFVVDGHGRWEVAPPANAGTPGTGQISTADFQPGSTSFRVSGSYEPVPIGGSAESQTWTWVGNSEVWTSFCIVLAPVPTTIQVEVGNYTEGDAGGSFNHTLTSSSNRIVLVIIDDESPDQATGVTYDGVAMTQVLEVTETQGFGNAGSMWGILEIDLPAGPGSFAVVVSGLDVGAGVDVLEISSVNQIIPNGSQIATITSTAAILSLTVSPTVPIGGESVLVGMGANGGPRAYDDPPTGDGTYVRLADHTAPPTSAQMATAFQIFVDESGPKDYTETFIGPTTTRLILFAAVFQEFGAEMPIDALPTNF
jgi:hypothetical protein